MRAHNWNSIERAFTFDGRDASDWRGSSLALFAAERTVDYIASLERDRSSRGRQRHVLEATRAATETT